MRAKGLDFGTALKEAQARGYAEADPRFDIEGIDACLLYTSPSPRDRTRSRMPSSACKKKIKYTTFYDQQNDTGPDVTI